MTSVQDYLTQGSNIFLSGWKSRISPKKYSGSAPEICEKIVKDCWNGRYFQSSKQNFSQFWARDFGLCVQALLKQGYKSEVHQTLRYALNRFKDSGKITTAISSQGRPFDFPTKAVDSLPWLIHAIKLSAFHYLPFQGFINRELKRYVEEVIDPNTGLVKPNKHFSSIKDFAVRKSSCYDNCLVGLLARDLSGMKLNHPLNKFNYPELLKRHFWSGEFFYDDLRKKDYVAGDANIFPFILGLVKDKEMVESAVKSIQTAGLDSPLPLKYTAKRREVNFIWQEALAMRGYESDAIWTQMGLLFIRLVKSVDKSKAVEYQNLYRQLIEEYFGFPEVLTAQGKLFKTWFYYCDRSMLWAVNYLDL